MSGTQTAPKLSNCLLSAEQQIPYKQCIANYPQWFLSARQLCDLELLINGGFSPLTGFLGQIDYESVLHGLELANGQLWPMPITLDVDKQFAASLHSGDHIALLSPDASPLAILKLSDIWVPDKQREAQAVFATTDPSHPGVHYLMQQANEVYLGGQLMGLSLPQHYDYPKLRHTPAQVREMFKDNGWQRVVGFQTRNPLHRAHHALTCWAMQQTQANLLLHPVVGMTKPGDVDAYSRVRCYEKLMPHYQAKQVLLSLLPLAMRMGGPREALWHALIRQNYGCSHFVIGRDHAGPGKDSQGEDFYEPFAAHELVKHYQDRLAIDILYAPEFAYIKEKKTFLPKDQVTAKDTVLQVSGTEFRRMLDNNEAIPEWFSFPEIIAELKQVYQAKAKQGITLFFTGLSGSGKSTLANALCQRLQALGHVVTLLDGDVIRQHLCPELGFSKKDRDLNVKRIAYVASEISKHHGIAICAQIAPYQHSRQAAREMLSNKGLFVEVHVATPLSVCEQRDKKGLYAQARAGKIQNFTGIDDPYEAPTQAEITLNTDEFSIQEGTEIIMEYLQNHL